MAVVTIDNTKRLSSRQKVAARAMDHTNQALYSSNGVPDVVAHGGNAIWRVYGSGRYSHDVDVYSKAHITKDHLEEMFKTQDMQLVNYRDTGCVIFAKAAYEENKIRIVLDLEFMRKKMEGVLGSYTRTDGSKIDILVLTPEELIKEKIYSYNNRGELRDLYDIYHLGAKVIGKENVAPDVKHNIAEAVYIRRDPIDTKEFERSIYTGRVPEYNELVMELKKFSRSDPGPSNVTSERARKDKDKRTA